LTPTGAWARSVPVTRCVPHVRLGRAVTCNGFAASYFFHGKEYPREMGGPQVEPFLSHLATVGRVAASTQKQALSALPFLYREVLQLQLPWMDGVVRAKRPKHGPVVLTENEVRALLAQIEGTRWLVVSLLYSSGTRLLEGLRLHVKDVDFERHEIDDLYARPQSRRARGIEPA